MEKRSVELTAKQNMFKKSLSCNDAKKLSDALQLKQTKAPLSTQHHSKDVHHTKRKEKCNKASRMSVIRKDIGLEQRSLAFLQNHNVKVDFESEPLAWACLINSSQEFPEVIYLKRKSTKARPGTVIGSNPSVDIMVRHQGFESRHCVIYPGNYTLSNGETVLRGILSNLSSQEIKVNDVPLLRMDSQCLKSFDSITFESNKITSYIFLLKSEQGHIFEHDYKIINSIGVGHFAEVFTAKENSTNSIFAVKVIQLCRFRKRPKALLQFKREVTTLMSLEPHPGIISILRTYEDSLHLYIVMDFAEQGELFNYIINRLFLTESQARVILYQLFRAVKFLHDNDIVHRDIKPENILLVDQKTLEVKLCDFGLANLCTIEKALVSVCGTENYVAPEIINHIPGYGKTCDLWSLGVVLFVCLIGRAPFDDPNNHKVMDNIRRANFDFTPVDPKSKPVSDSAKDLIRGLLTVDTTKRYTMEQALEHPWMNFDFEEMQASIVQINPIYEKALDRESPPETPPLVSTQNTQESTSSP